MKRGRREAKSHSGCQNCKDRKVKCDESTPICQMCYRSGVSCPGYHRPLKWSRKHELGGPSTSGSRMAAGARQPRGYQFRATHEATTQCQHGEIYPSVPVTPQSFSSWIGLDLAGGSRSVYEGSSFICHDLSTSTPSFLESIPFTTQDLSLELLEDPSFRTPSRSETLADGVPPSSEPEVNISHLSNLAKQRKTDETGKDKSKHSATGSRALLQTFYRLSSSGKYLTGLSDHDFVGYYFKHVNRLISCFDSRHNTLYDLVVKHWATSSTVFFAIQSMAIAHISNCYPYMAEAGITKRSQAWRSLQRDLQLLRIGCIDLENVLLSLTLLGISASWQSTPSLGLQYLYIARNLIIQGQRQWDAPRNSATLEHIDDFWADILVYWEMIASFVDPVPITTFDGHGLPSLERLARPSPIMPHPWTGVVTELYFALAEVGRVRRRQQRISTLDKSDQELASHELDRRWLEKLEQFLLAIQIPDIDSIQDFEDRNTSKPHLVRTAEACRSVGLLEIYSLCPEMFRDRITKDSGQDELPFTIPQDQSGSAEELQSYLGALAVHCLNLIREVPLSSGASRFQPLLLVACASQLRLSNSDDDLATDDGSSQDQDNGIQHRYVVEERMLALSRKFPQIPILRATDIIKETWARLDAGDDAHWIGVMHEKELQTMLG